MGCHRNQNTVLEVAHQCAPVLAGIKPSNLLIVEKIKVPDIVEVLQGMDVGKKLLHKTDTKSVWLIYRSTWLKELLDCRDIADFFRTYGYTKLTELDVVLSRLGQRYVAYLDSRTDFHHEIGLLLGYPIADVQGYILNKGRYCLLNGYWKVYSDAEGAKKIFDIYTKVRQFFVREVKNGKQFYQIPGTALAADGSL